MSKVNWFTGLKVNKGTASRLNVIDLDFNPGKWNKKGFEPHSGDIERADE